MTSTQSSGTVWQWAAILEAIPTFFTGLLCVFAPKLTLDQFLSEKSLKNTEALAVAYEEFRWFGPMMFLITALLCGGIPNRPVARSHRPLIYLSIMVSEITMLPLLFNFVNRVGAWTLTGSIPLVAFLGLPILWRSYCVFINPRVMGPEFERSRSSKQS